MAFYVGQKVIRVDALSTNGSGDIELVEGQVYTIARVVSEVSVYKTPKTPRRHSQGVGFVLGELRNRSVPFAATRFRPIVERKTDISIFKAMLNPSKTEVSA